MSKTRNLSDLLDANGDVKSGALDNVTQTTINNNADNRLITGSGTANTLEGEANLTFNGTNLGIGEASPSAQLHIKGSDITDQVIIENTNSGAETAPDLTLYRSSSSPADNDTLGNIIFRGKNDANEDVNYFEMTGVIADASDGSEDTQVDFSGKSGGSNHTFMKFKAVGVTDIIGTLNVNGSALSGGITMVDQWRLTTGFTGDATPIASNLERVDSSAFGQIGSGMSVSSGYWTFPSTGVYLVMASGFFRFGTVGGEEADGNFQIYATTDNSSYSLLTGSKFSFAYDYAIRENHRTISAVVDVTNTTNVKVYFTTNAVTSGTTTSGNTDRNETHFTFIRLGDT